MLDDLVKTLDMLTTATTLSTQQNKVLKPILPPAPIPARSGSAKQTRSQET